MVNREEEDYNNTSNSSPLLGRCIFITCLVVGIAIIYKVVVVLAFSHTSNLVGGAPFICPEPCKGPTHQLFADIDYKKLLDDNKDALMKDIDPRSVSTMQIQKEAMKMEMDGINKCIWKSVLVRSDGTYNDIRTQIDTESDCSADMIDAIIYEKGWGVHTKAYTCEHVACITVIAMDKDGPVPTLDLCTSEIMGCIPEQLLHT
jgi:hypothetical protein